MNSSSVRVRFAPSPTGFFHIGSARTALFNWLYARHTGGTFVLRIEDTDAARNSEEFLNVIYDSLKWLGMDWDEGPGAGGDFGPYRQSERGEIYKEYLEKLKAAGRTYEKDGAVWFKLNGERSEVFDEHRKKMVTKVANEAAVIDDAIRGRVERVEDEDFVIVRSDGSPVFHFVNVVDDITMRITHVIRGEDHLSNTSKHVELFKAFGAPMPVFAHIPLILKQNGPGKMSKRDQGALIEEYQRRGYLPEAVVNFLALLGWNPGGDREKMDVREIIELFDLPAVNQSNARFDDRKMAHMNMSYVLALAPDVFVEKARDFYAANKVPSSDDAAFFAEVMKLCQPKIKGFEDLPAYAAYFFTEEFSVDEKAKAKVLGKGEPKVRLEELLGSLSGADFSSDASIEEAIKKLAESKGLGFGDYQSVARLAVSGTNVGPSLTGMFRVLGRECVLARMGRFLEGIN